MPAARFGGSVIAALLGGCTPELPTPPVFAAVDVRCDDAGSWAFSARVDHDEEVIAVEADLFAVFEGAESYSLGTVILEPSGIEWVQVFGPDALPLDCAYPGDYGYAFFAQDAEGDVAWRELVRSGLDARVQRGPP